MYLNSEFTVIERVGQLSGHWRRPKLALVVVDYTRPNRRATTRPADYSYVTVCAHTDTSRLMENKNPDFIGLTVTIRTTSCVYPVPKSFVWFKSFACEVRFVTHSIAIKYSLNRQIHRKYPKRRSKRADYTRRVYVV